MKNKIMVYISLYFFINKEYYEITELAIEMDM